jgi:predicted amidohydrolase YtcJ
MPQFSPRWPVALSRRRFLATTAAAGGLAAFAPRAFGAAFWGQADVILSGGTFHTMDPAQGPVEALAVRGDRILAVGSVADIAALAGPGTERIDTRGLTVTPGFIDAHSHPLMANEAVSVNVDFRTIPEVQAALRAKAAATPPGQWVQGHMYDDTKFAEGRPVTRADLDAVSTAHPVFIRHRGGHTAVVNSMAFAVAGVTLDTPDPEGGKYYREAGGFTGRIA